MKYFLLVPIFALGLLAEDAPKKAPAPALTDHQVIDYLKAVLASTQSQLNACKAPEAVQAAIGKLSETCALTLAPDGITPMCQPPAAKPAAK